ncbi:MAG TPA: deoxyribose-phosphate aldolase [Kiritimatiellia bacterium]|nr:deoxyribose-phosphate aldolase [Kiritimatiellia bacterium]HOR98686.1 deoxyribose-phosphate aldolase [Kiritimatiellia bacterium]
MRVEPVTQTTMARMMDHAVLNPAMTENDIRRAAAMCRARGVGNLCVRPTDAALAASLLKGSATTVAVVVGFPHGASRSEVKALEARLAIEDGAAELDMVMNIGKFLSGDYEYVKRDIEAVVAVAKPQGVLVKVIQESCLLTLDQVAKACELTIAAGADFVKTSTGFNGDGATVEQVEVMLKTCAGRTKVKPSGGIRDWERAAMFVRMGVDRLGVSSTDKILDGAPTEDGC